MLDSASSRLSRFIVTALAVTIALTPHLVAAPVDAALGPLRSIAFPAAAKSGEPSLSVDPSGVAYATWLEKGNGTRHALRLSKLTGEQWSAPRTIVEGDSFFVNWADTPILLARGGGRLAVSYPWRSGAGTYSYDVRVIQSFDGGQTWTAPVTPHDDGTPTEHGFVSLLDEGDRVRLVWLDGRNTKMPEAGHDSHGHGAEMTLRTATLDGLGHIHEEAELDARVCDCCQTAAAPISGGVLVAYRDRSREEIRDISLARSGGGRWSDPHPLRVDGWKMHACPVNGPSLAADGDRVAAAWFTEASGTPRVWFAKSIDGGRTFTGSTAISDTSAIGRASVLLRPDGAALVTWLDHAPGAGRIVAREVDARGALGPTIEIARTSSTRRSGFPRTALRGNRVIFLWTEVTKDQDTRLRCAGADWK